MVTTTIFIHLGSTTKFTQRNHERAIEHAALVQIGDEGCNGLVPCRQTLVQGLEQLGVVIPTAIVDGDEGDTRLHQPTGQKGTLAEGVASIKFTHAQRFSGEVKSGLGTLRLHQVGSLVVVLVEGNGWVCHGLVEIAAVGIYLATKGGPTLMPERNHT